MKHVRRLRRAMRLLHHQRRALLREVLVNRRRLREATGYPAHAKAAKKEVGR